MFILLFDYHEHVALYCLIFLVPQTTLIGCMVFYFIVSSAPICPGVLELITSYGSYLGLGLSYMLNIHDI